MPFSIIGSTEDVQTPDGRVVKGREYLWGVAEGKSSCASWLIQPVLLTHSCSGKREPL